MLPSVSATLPLHVYERRTLETCAALRRRRSPLAPRRHLCRQSPNRTPAPRAAPDRTWNTWVSVTHTVKDALRTLLWWVARRARGEASACLSWPFPSLCTAEAWRGERRRVGTTYGGLSARASRARASEWRNVLFGEPSRRGTSHTPSSSCGGAQDLVSRTWAPYAPRTQTALALKGLALMTVGCNDKRGRVCAQQRKGGGRRKKKKTLKSA